MQMTIVLSRKQVSSKGTPIRRGVLAKIIATQPGTVWKFRTPKGKRK